MDAIKIAAGRAWVGLCLKPTEVSQSAATWRVLSPFLPTYPLKFVYFQPLVSLIRQSKLAHN